jgi:uncharacterized protein YfaS (alpha-2-macroglobulin family)
MNMNKISRGVVALVSFLLLAGASAALADYQPPRSVPFFILTDRQYGSADESLLRVEVPGEYGLETAQALGGVEVRLYRVEKALDFLKAQKNLHRIDVRARPRNADVANTLSYLWSNAWNKSRDTWKGIFTPKARGAVTKEAPGLKTRYASPEYRPRSRFALLEGHELAVHFYYPISAAKAIEPPAAKLSGSSSNFIEKNIGNFYVPLGKLKPGLYIAEAILGTHRAVTLVFVSDTVALTKMASQTLTVWTAHRVTGQPVAGTKLEWTDGNGVLASARTDDEGLATLSRVSPERSYLLGEDAAGGVFVSENFYYDSEIYDTKLYAVTDRPLYRPGDTVYLKFVAREYQAANLSVPAKAADLDIRVFDPNGIPVWRGTAPLASDLGGEAFFRLPDEAFAGGYEIRVGYQGKAYSAAFRVAEYIKPHFEIVLMPDKESFKTGEAVTGKVRLIYPNGDPVKNAAVELTLRAQALTMVQGELRYGGLFPVQLNTATLTTDKQGEAKFSLPPVKEPSRLIVSLLATDGAAYRVRNTREFMVERAAAVWRLASERRFSLPKETPLFTLESESGDGREAPPATWEITRLEDQAITSGKFDPAARQWRPRLEQSGSYSLILRDAAGNIVAATSHWVVGDGVKTLPGTIELVADKKSYREGETAEILMTFSEPVEEALLTLERDRVESSALLSAAQKKGKDWVRVERVAPNQWRARLPVREAYAPNMTFSIAYVKNGEYLFQNAGLVVAVPRVELAITPDKKTAGPGDTVTVDISATVRGKPAQALLTVSVVDEMIYALQPEIAPDVVEFFQHVRRNNVRTGASLNFIAYDEAADYAQDAALQPPARHQYNERGVKVLERARRDDTDTAAWLPRLVTGKDGKARFTFKVPDALSRWRITVRAVGLDAAEKGGIYGQRTAFVLSDKPLYAKWTSPDWLREGDAPVASLAVFNNSPEEKEASVVLRVAGKELTQKTTLPRGVVYLSFPLPSFAGAQTARLEVREKDKVADALETTLTAQSLRWRGTAEQVIALDGEERAAFRLPIDARNVRLSLVGGGSEHFLRIADSLIDYPWGCVEQTSSRLIPLSIVAPLFNEKSQGAGGKIGQMLYSQRLRLAALAGPNASFGWWGDGSQENVLMSAYAYYADWRAAQALNLSLPTAHWERLLEIYRQDATNEPLLHNALSLWFAQQIGLPVRTQAEGLLAQLNEKTLESKDAQRNGKESVIFSEPSSPLGFAYARVLTTLVAREAGLKTAEQGNHAAALAILKKSALPSARALLLMAGEGDKGGDEAGEILAATRADAPTIDRALTLVWTQKALGGALNMAATNLRPADAKWQESPQRFAASSLWRWTGDKLPDGLQISGERKKNTSAILRYETASDSAESALPVTLERRLYRLERQKVENNEVEYAAVPVKPGDGLSTQELYLDEIHISAQGLHRFGIIEAPLPPGANVEKSTWGVRLRNGENKDGKDNSEAMDRSRAEEQRDRYGIPVETVGAEGLVFRHLLRVSQTGRFTLPPIRYHRMYQPEQKAYAKGGETVWVVK